MRTSTILLLLFAAMGLLGYLLAKPKTLNLYGKINDASGLTTGADIYIKGLQVGEVKDLSFDGDSILIHFAIDKEIELNKASEFQINREKEIFGATQIDIIPKQSDLGIYKNKDHIHSRKITIKKSKQSLEDVTKSLNKLFDNMSEAERNKELQKN